MRSKRPHTGTADGADLAAVLHAFASQFVDTRLRERFVHEALKKPRDLHRRVCHNIESLFNPAFRGRPAPFQDEEDCLLLDWSGGFQHMSWQQAESLMQSGGGGYLAIKADGSGFYAETEGYAPCTYASGEA